LPCREVVGVTRDVRQRSILPDGGEDRLMQYFVPFSQVPDPPFAPNPTHIRGLLLHVSGDPSRLLSTIRRLVVAGRTDLPYVRVRPYEQLLERQMRPWTTGTRLLGLFSALALVVVAVGLYAAFAHAVSDRGREMAIRMAVGARPVSVLALVLREACGLAGLGVILGCIVAMMGGRFTQSLWFGTDASDPVVLVAASLLMVLVAALATFLPARAASKADPSVLLRSE
jgi:predicted lysophospholipase L1 biosynthesis ABC-type transport system permease subunit